MWKLFPDSWLERAGLFEHRHAAAAAALERSWREWLELAVKRVSPRTFEAHGFDAVETLRDLSGRALLSVDEALRTDSFRHQAPPVLSRSLLSTDANDETLADAYSFVASCNPNGFVRERAVIAFARYPCPLAFAAGLIRSTDWVPQVRDAGISLVKSVLPRLAPSDVVRFLDLAVRIKDRARLSHDLWQTAIEPRLKAAENRGALWAAACNPTNVSELRRSAFEFLVLGTPEQITELLQSAVNDPDPRIGLWGLSRISELTQADQRVFLKGALTATHAAVRRTALRQYGALSPDDYAETLRAALFDPAHGVRALAAFELQHSQAESPLPIWRAAVKDSRRWKSDVAVLSLCEFGERQDVEDIAASVVARNATVRASVLRGLWRVGSSRLDASLAAGLHDPSTLVIRRLADIYRRGTVALDVTALENALASADVRIARKLLALSEVLGKWEGLEFLLRHVVGDDADRAACTADCVDRWIRNENRRFTAPSRSQIQRLVALSRAAQARHSERDWRSIDLSLAAFA